MQRNKNIKHGWKFSETYLPEDYHQYRTPTNIIITEIYQCPVCRLYKLKHQSTSEGVGTTIEYTSDLGPLGKSKIDPGCIPNIHALALEVERRATRTP